MRLPDAVARWHLAWLLDEVLFAEEPIAVRPDEEVGRLLWRLWEPLGAIEPTWAMPEEDWRGPDARAQLTHACGVLRECVEAIARGDPTPRATPMTLRVYLSWRVDFPERRTRWMLEGRLGDAVIWAGFKLLSLVDRSLIRRCDFPGCPRVFVGTKNQRRCRRHQAEARRQTQRRAERAFRARQRQPKTTPKRRRTRR
jgi:hypothetical protein